MSKARKINYPITASDFFAVIEKQGQLPMWRMATLPAEDIDDTCPVRSVFWLADDLNCTCFVAFEYGKLLVSLQQKPDVLPTSCWYWFDLDRLHETDWVSHIGEKLWCSDLQREFLKELYRLFPHPVPPKGVRA